VATSETGIKGGRWRRLYTVVFLKALALHPSPLHLPGFSEGNPKPRSPELDDGGSFGVTLPPGASFFEASVGWERQEVDRCCIFLVDNGGSRRHGTTGSR
jgi:hypothetical protein